MAEWLSVAEGRSLDGLRLVLTAGVPGPWGEAAKAIFHVKGLDCPRIAQFGGQPNTELVAWTGEKNAPQALFNDEPVRTDWISIIRLGERLAAERIAEILEMMAAQWSRQRKAGLAYLIGDRLSALDLYWAAFAALLGPLPDALCPMPAGLRAGYSQRSPEIDAALDPALLDHRQAIYDTWLELPIDLGPGFSP